MSAINPALASVVVYVGNQSDILRLCIVFIESDNYKDNFVVLYSHSLASYFQGDVTNNIAAINLNVKLYQSNFFCFCTQRKFPSFFLLWIRIQSKFNITSASM